MHARNRRTGAPIVATLERVYGKTSLIRDGFRKHEDGLLEREIESPTEMLWNTSEAIAYLDATTTSRSTATTSKCTNRTRPARSPRTRPEHGTPTGHPGSAPGGTRLKGPAHSSTRPPGPETRLRARSAGW